MKIGMKAPTVRVPCIFQDTINFLPLSDFSETQFALCCLSDLEEHDAWFLEAQVQEFTQAGSALAVLVSSDLLLGQDWVRAPKDFSLSFFIDPISRLRRAFHLSHSLQPHRCETLIFDQSKRLSFRLIHDLNLKGLSAVLDIMNSDFLQASAGNSVISGMNLSNFEPRTEVSTIRSTAKV